MLSAMLVTALRNRHKLTHLCAPHKHTQTHTLAKHKGARRPRVGGSAVTVLHFLKTRTHTHTHTHTHLPNTKERAGPVLEAVVRCDSAAFALAARPKNDGWVCKAIWFEKRDLYTRVAPFLSEYGRAFPPVWRVICTNVGSNFHQCGE